jgi:hypothetical protein
MYANYVTNVYVCLVVFKLAIIKHSKLATPFNEILFIVLVESR